MTRKIHVLYAEDNAFDADLTRTHFERNAPDLEVEIVRSGQQCLARLHEGSYDVLLLDNHLPDMDGIDLLKELPSREIRLPVVTVTGVGDESLVLQVLRLGASDYVPKHGSYLDELPGVLRNAVTEWHKLRERGLAAGSRQQRVLYIERNPADIDLTSRHLAEAAPYLILKAIDSSADALELLRNGEFDAVLADLRMPDMNALDLLKNARQAGLQVPFIIMTGQGDENAAVAALKLGAADYIVKRQDYLTQLPYAIDNAVARAQLLHSNRRLESELAERQRAEEEKVRLLAEVLHERRRLEEIVASVPGIVWETWGRPEAPGQKMDFVSSYAEQLLGYSVQEWLTTPNLWQNIVHPEDRARALRQAAEVFASGKPGTGQFRWIAKDGRVVWVEVRATVICDEKGNPLGMRGVTMDITANKEAERERARLEEQLLQAQKMESIGRLAGGVAHDFNNLLTVINGYAEMALIDEPNAGSDLRADVDEIKSAGQRAAELTRQLLALSRRQLLQPRVLDLNSLITNSIKTLQRLLGEDIQLNTVLDSGLGHIKADPSQMDQVVLNLAVNSRDAMPQGGTLMLETRNTVLDAPHAHELALPPGPYVTLAITDSGHGMDSDTLVQIFEPFFTTKEMGKGTGLGLSMVYGIVKQSGGSLRVESRPGQGTRFEVYLPRVDEPEAVSQENPAESGALTGSETVLVVEDEESVRKLTCHALRKYGYGVIEAANGGEALLACEKHKTPIPLMITDVVMPQMSGRDLATRLRQLHPEMKVLFMSGYTDDAIVRHGLPSPNLLFMQKPFTPVALAQQVRHVLDLEQATPPAA